MRFAIYRVFVHFTKGYHNEYEVRCNYLDEETKKKVEDYVRETEPEREIKEIKYAYQSGQERFAPETFTIKEWKN